MHVIGLIGLKGDVLDQRPSISSKLVKLPLEHQFGALTMEEF